MRFRPLALSAALLVLVAGCSTSALHELEPTPPERTDMPKVSRTIPPHEALPGTNARTALLFTTPLPGLGAHLEVREYYVAENNEVTITPPSEALFEIRSGKFDVAAPELKGEHGTGTTWTAAPGERVAVRTTSELAVLRATYIVKE